MENIKEKIERHKERAVIFRDENIKAFIIDSENTYHFCYIKSVDENRVGVFEFVGKLTGEATTILFVDIIKFVEYREERG